jgi:hypothetical protein
MKMGKFQDEYMCAVDGKSYYYSGADKKVDRDRFMKVYEAGFCPKCKGPQRLEDGDRCPIHGDMYESYLMAKHQGNPVPKETPKLSAAEAAADPAHYKDIVPGYEYMQLMEHLLGYEGTVAHLKGQIYKYLMRCGKKDDPYQEMLKVQWYSNYLTEMMKRKTNGDFPHTPENTLGE